MSTLLLVLLAAFGVTTDPPVPVRFVEVSSPATAGYAMPDGMAAGIAAADYDDDGDVDLFVPTAVGTPDRLLRNDGGTFVDVATSAGLASIEPHRAGLWFDADGDMRLDLVVAGDCFAFEGSCPVPLALRLYRQREDATFEDVTLASGLAAPLLPAEDTHVGGLCAGDVDRDGDLDLFAAFWEGPAALFVNDDAGVFVDASVAAGVAGTRPHWQPVMVDIDEDGWLDIFQAVDFAPNVLWLNARDGTFRDIAPLVGADNAMNDMGVAIGDYDNDGDLDAYVTEAYGVDEYNVLLRQGTGPRFLRFTEVAKQAGVDQGFIGWGTTWLDVDRDGWLDLAETNGFGGQTRLFHSSGGTDPVFVDIAADAGVAASYAGSGLVAFDLERDGDLDLVEACAGAGPLRVLECRSGPETAGWLTVRLRQQTPNSRGIGARVSIEAAGLTQTRLITAGTSCLSQEPAEAFFGLGPARRVDRLRIDWPDGTASEFGPVAVGQVFTVRR